MKHRLHPPAAPTSTEDWVLTVFFLILGAYLAFFLHRKFQSKGEEGEVTEELEGGMKLIRPVGFLLFLYSVGEILYRLYTFYPGR